MCSELSHRGDDACELHCINNLHILYVEYFVMYICIYGYILKRNYLGGRLKSGSSLIFYKTVHGIEEVLYVLMIEMNKCIWYILC